MAEGRREGREGREEGDGGKRLRTVEECERKRKGKERSAWDQLHTTEETTMSSR